MLAAEVADVIAEDVERASGSAFPCASLCFLCGQIKISFHYYHDYQ